MKTPMKYAGLALGLVAVIGVLGLLAGGRTPFADQSKDALVEVAPDEVMASIDAALGRQTVQPVGPKAAEQASRSAGAPAAGAPAADAASGAASASGGLTGADTAALPSVDNRKIVQTASIRLQVKAVAESFGEVSAIATSAGGFVASSNFAYQGEQQVATITLRVPAQAYQETLAKVRALGAKIDSETSNASDVTEEFSDLQARIRTLEAMEQQLLQLLSQARNVNEVLQVQDRLNSVRTQIEQARGRIQLLEKLSDYATISVHLRPVAPPVKVDGGVDLGAEIAKAWEDSLQFLATIAAAVLTVVVFSWWLLPLGILGLAGWQRWVRSRPALRPAAYD
ncbi:MAG TPA: DUF4349 domain-containing protein [Dehalococcoidia bacterium]|nr:DUF4349 domain-containing protein [Dehalococcoidia bacterium]